MGPTARKIRKLEWGHGRTRRGKASSIPPWKRPLYRTSRKEQVETPRSVAIQGTFFVPAGSRPRSTETLQPVSLGMDTLQHDRKQTLPVIRRIDSRWRHCKEDKFSAGYDIPLSKPKHESSKSLTSASPNVYPIYISLDPFIYTASHAHGEQCWISSAQLLCQEWLAPTNSGTFWPLCVPSFSLKHLETQWSSPKKASSRGRDAPRQQKARSLLVW